MLFSQSACWPMASSRSSFCADSLPSTSPAWMLAWMWTLRRLLARTAAGLPSLSPAPTTAMGIARPSYVFPYVT